MIKYSAKFHLEILLFLVTMANNQEVIERHIPIENIHTFYNINLQEKPELPTTSSENTIQELVFKESTLPVLSTAMFQGYVQLRNLHLSNCHITLIGAGVFSGLTILEKLYLDHNNISEISRGTLNSLSTLRIFSMSHNSLRNIELGSFSGLYKLKELNLSHNFLTTIDLITLISLNALEHFDISYNTLAGFTPKNSHVYQDLQKLQKICLNNNKLTEIPLSLIGNLTQIEYFDISYNYLNELDFGQFVSPSRANYSNNRIRVVTNWENVIKALVIDLSNNDLTNISKRPADVSELFLMGNKFQYLESSMFMGFNNLKKLDLSYNVIGVLDTNAFNGLQNLTELNLSSNVIKELPVGCFQELDSLSTLHLSHNTLQTIHFGTFTGLNHLKTLHLDHNNLTRLFENSFYVLQELEYISLIYNNLSSLNVGDFAKAMPLLKSVDLNFNKVCCNDLLNITKSLEKLNIEFVKGNSFNEPNIFGITCDDVAETPHLRLALNTPDDNSTLVGYWTLFVLLVVVVVIDVVLNALRLVRQCQLKKKKPNENTVVEIKQFRSVIVDSKADSSDNVYSNID